jgi:hypothetical protein
MKYLPFAFCIFGLGLSLRGQNPDEGGISPEVRQCVKRAVAWLLTQQRPQGCFMDADHNEAVPQASGAMTALTIMGLSSVGNMPSDPTPEGRAMIRALKFMTESIVPTDEGYLGQADRSRMYGHGIMTLMYAEMLGQTLDDAMDKKIRGRLKNAIDLIIHSQDVIKSEANRGGWRYEPGSSDADISVSVWQVTQASMCQASRSTGPWNTSNAATAASVMRTACRATWRRPSATSPMVAGRLSPPLRRVCWPFRFAGNTTRPK